MEASWGSWGPLGPLGAGGRFDVKHHFETLEISGRAVLKPSRGRFLFFKAILELFLRAFWLLSPQQIQHAKSTSSILSIPA